MQKILNGILLGIFLLMGGWLFLLILYDFNREHLKIMRSAMSPAEFETYRKNYLSQGGLLGMAHPEKP